MKVHLIKRQSVERFVTENARSRVAFEAWLSIIKRVEWDTPSDITATFNSADLLGNGSERVVFNIGGNNYRLICKYFFGETRVHLFVKWIGSHAEYTKLCKEGKQYTVNIN
jgi:mRNA interferase HigB